MLRYNKLYNRFFTFLVFSSYIGYLSASACNFNVKVKQVLKDEGFHRNLTYGIVFNSEDNQCWMYEDCIIAVDQTLPRGVFANSDDLSTLRRLNKLNAIPKNPVNIELPAEHSYATTTYIVEKVKDCKVYTWLPVHARYHLALYGGGTVRNSIGPPKLFLRCPDQRLDMCRKGANLANVLCNGSAKDKCSWKEVSYTLVTDTVVWDVPVGDIEHYYKISFGTALVVSVASLYAIKALHELKLNINFNPYNS